MGAPPGDAKPEQMYQQKLYLLPWQAGAKHRPL